MDKRQRPYAALLLLGAVIWGSAFVAQRSVAGSIGPLTFNAVRLALAALAVAPAALMASRRAGERPRKNRRSTVLGGLVCGTFLAGASVFQQMGLQYTPAGKAGFITALYILLVPAVRLAVFRVRPPWPTWAAVALGVVGLYLLSVTDAFTLTGGDTLVCVCALLFTGQILSCDYFAPRGEPLAICGFQFLTASVLSGLFAFLLETPAWADVADAAWPIVYCGVLSGGLGYSLQMICQKHLDATVASLLMSMESVFAVLSGALILGERMTPRELTGCAVMLAAIIFVQLFETGGMVKTRRL